MKRQNRIPECGREEHASTDRQFAHHTVSALLDFGLSHREVCLLMEIFIRSDGSMLTGRSRPVGLSLSRAASALRLEGEDVYDMLTNLADMGLIYYLPVDAGGDIFAIYVSSAYIARVVSGYRNCLTNNTMFADGQ